MNHKPLILAVTLVALLVIGGVFWVMEKRPVATHQSVVTKPVAEAPIQTEPEKYPQHIEAIPGNTDEVWYNIPELGVRMKLNKEFAEDLIYAFESEDKSTAYFSSKKITEVSSCLLPPVDSPFGALFKAKGSMKEDAKTDEYFAARVGGYVQIGKYYYGWAEPQEVCWDLDGKRNNVFPITYEGSGPKTVSEAIKTVEALK